MSTSVITAPASSDMPGDISTVYGPTRVTFTDGVARVDDLPEGLRNYFLAAGYNVDGDEAAPQPAPDIVDARDATGELVGTALRDAAVDPRAGDFLAPVNAGDADPHGPLVVSPGIHNEGDRAVRPGVVSSDPAVQQAAEKATAEAVLVDNVTADAAVTLAVPDRKDLGDASLSDPGSAEWGREHAEENRAREERERAEAEEGRLSTAGRGLDEPNGLEPKGNASTEAWAGWAIAQGATPEEVDGKTRDELRAAYGS